MIKGLGIAGGVIFLWMLFSGASPNRTGWEYASLSWVGSEAVWTTPTTHVGPDPFQIYQKLGGALDQNGFRLGLVGRTRAILELTGRDGWELASVHDDAGGETFWLKRPS